MSLKFGTSGVRGLETELTNEECARFARAFIQHYLPLRGHRRENACVIAGDLRRSTPRILDAITTGLAQEGFAVLDAGIVPTPALAYECASRDLPLPHQSRGSTSPPRAKSIRQSSNASAPKSRVSNAQTNSSPSIPKRSRTSRP